jgi:hypothetical protein
VPDVTFTAWRGQEFGAGAGPGFDIDREGLRIGVADRRREYPVGSGLLYEAATWSSPPVTVEHPCSELVASWNAVTPVGTWLEVGVRAQFEDGTGGSFLLARWAADNPPTGALWRTSIPGQETAYARVDTDTLAALHGHTIHAWQLIVTLLRLAGTNLTPTVRLAAAVTSGLRAEKAVAAGPLGQASRAAVDLQVPTYSQELHREHYPQFDGGGEAWCSPTSTAMVLSYWGIGPSAADLAGITPPIDPMVDFAAQHVYDDAYNGCGNWSFNVAYAARFGLEGFVTRLRSLAEAELFLAAGIPLVASVSFSEDELTGAGYGTQGHLLVVRGFTTSGDVVVNDPASHRIPDNGEVCVVYDRAEFENAWVPKRGGVVYVLRPSDCPLPVAPAQANW